MSCNGPGGNAVGAAVIDAGRRTAIIGGLIGAAADGAAQGGTCDLRFPMTTRISFLS